MKIKSVTSITLDEPVPVYDATSPKYHNYVLANGCVVHNTAKLARDKNFQATFSLKGKPLNVMEATKDKVNSNKEIAGLFAGIGLDLSLAAPVEKIRFGKILFLTDPDVDGPVIGSTKVLTSMGSHTIKSLAQKWKTDKTPFLVYSRDETGQLILASATNPCITNIETTLVTITLDDKNTVTCSPNHKWVLDNVDSSDPRFEEYKGNFYTKTSDLKVGDSINSTYITKKQAANTKPGTKIFEQKKTSIITAITKKGCEPTPVYCLTVEETGNFMLDDGEGNGICSSNCHINTLLLVLFQKYLPDLFKAGMIYLVVAPEYLAKYKKKIYFGSSVEDIHKQAGTKKLDIRHIKGWGEIEPEDMREIAFNPKVRKLIKVMPPNSAAGSKEFNALMGKDSGFRKKLLGV